MEARLAGAVAKAVLSALLVFLGAALAVWGPGTGPAIGMAVFLIALGLTVFLVANVGGFLRRTTRAEDYRGTCPVGESCKACGAFNYKPRRTCRSCEAPVNQTEAS